jgi:hypothetical protein
MTMKRSGTRNVKKIPSRSLQNESFSKTRRYRMGTLTRGSKLGNELRDEWGVSSLLLVNALRHELGVSSSLDKNPSQSLGQRLWRVWAETPRHRLRTFTRGSAAIANELRNEAGLSTLLNGRPSQRCDNEILLSEQRYGGPSIRSTPHGWLHFRISGGVLAYWLLYKSMNHEPPRHIH